MSTSITLTTPHKGGQRALYKHPARFHVVACGRRWGKTEFGKLIVTETALRGGLVWWVSPTYDMSGMIWRELKRTLSPATISANGSERMIELGTGGIVKIWTGSKPDTMRGGAPDVVIIDEAAMIPSGDMWHAVIRPALSDKQGRAMFLSTPRGRNWFWQLYQLGLDPLNKQYKSWSFPTSANIALSHINDEIEEARLTLPDRLFRQEYLAEFIDDAGGVFRGVLDVSVLDRATPYAGEFVMGVDWGKSNDYTVVSVFDRVARKQVDMDRINKVGWHVQRAALVKMYNRWKPQTIIAEDNSIGDVNIEALQLEGLPVQRFHTSAQTKPPLIERYAAAIEKGEVQLLNDRVQVAEHQAYELERMPSGSFRYNAPAGAHDDTVMAAALAWHGCNSYINWLEIQDDWWGNGNNK